MVAPGATPAGVLTPSPLNPITAATVSSWALSALDGLPQPVEAFWIAVPDIGSKMESVRVPILADTVPVCQPMAAKPGETAAKPDGAEPVLATVTVNDFETIAPVVL